MIAEARSALQKQSIHGQAIRRRGNDRVAEIRSQLYRYAEDLQRILEQNGELESHYQALLDSSSKLQESHRELAALMRIARDMHFLTDFNGIILQANPASHRLGSEAELLHSNLKVWLHPEALPNFNRLLTEARLLSTSDCLEHGLVMETRSPAAPLLSVSAQVMAIHNEQGPSHLHWIMHDNDGAHEQECHNSLSAMAINSAAEGVMITNAAGEILSINPAFSRITGYSLADVAGKNARIMQSGQHDAAFYTTIWESLAARGAWSGKIVNRKKNGELYTELLSISAARGTDGKVLTYVAVFKEFPQTIEAERDLAYRAHHDCLTGLPNRLLLHERLAQLLAVSKRADRKFSLLFMDLNKFKAINDEYGHQVGDCVLQTVSERVSDALREADTFARLGGDEFIILAPGLAGDLAIERLCMKVQDIVSQPIAIAGIAHSVTASMGVAEYPCHGEDEETLLRHADQAMYRAKSAGQCYQTHASAMNETGED